LKKSKQIYVETNPNHPFIPQIEVALGDIYNKKGEMAKAVAAYSFATKSMQKIEPHYPDMAIWLSKKAKVMANQNKTNEGLLSLDTALHILQFEENNWQEIVAIERYLPLIRFCYRRYLFFGTRRLALKLFNLDFTF